MGSFFSDLLSFTHEVAVYDPDPQRLRFTYNAQRFSDLDEIDGFHPEMVINAATVKYTLDAFKAVLPPYRPILHTFRHLFGEDRTAGILCRVRTSVRFHPPDVRPTFASLSNLADENAIIISEGDHLGRVFFKDLYGQLGLHIEEYTFEEHDRTIAYSLSIPFASTLVFASVMKHQDAPGTTFKAPHGHSTRSDVGGRLPAERDTVQPQHPSQLDQIVERLATLKEIVERHDHDAMKSYLEQARQNLK